MAQAVPGFGPEMKHSLRWVPLSLLVSVVSLAIGAGLTIGANFGVHPLWTVAGGVWLATIGLPTTMGVVAVASLWGHSGFLTGFPGFIAAAVGVGMAFQLVAFLGLGRKVATTRTGGKPSNARRRWVSGIVAVLVVGAALGFTYRPLPALTEAVDGHAHLFGDEGWPPVHKRTCGLSPAQKANPTYGLLLRLLRLPRTGDLNELYVQELVRQAREAQAKAGPFRVVLLAQDARYTEAGEPDWENTSVYVPNEHLFRVVSRYPDLFLPCPSLNPQRRDWEAELDYCLNQGARVLKIHPPTQAVNPGDPRFRAFYRRCAERGMRIMVHTGAEHSAPVASASLGDPRFLELALEEGCVVIAAHAGTKAFFDPPAEDHFPVLVEMMAAHPRLLADTAVLGSQFRWRCVPGIVQTPAALPRMIHASDWPFPANALVHWHRMHPFFVIKLAAEKNLFLRDLRLKQALGMPVDSFVRIRDLLTTNAPPGRLREE